MVHTAQTDLLNSYGCRRVAAPGSMNAPPPSRASSGWDPRCPVPGPGGKSRSPGSAPCLAGFPNASCANQHPSSLEMLTVFISVTSSTHGSRPLSTSKTVFLSVSVRHLRQLQLVRGGRLCWSRQLQQQPVRVPRAGLGDCSSPHSVLRPQMWRYTPFKSASPKRPTSHEKGLIWLLESLAEKSGRTRCTQSRLWPCGHRSSADRQLLLEAKLVPDWNSTGARAKATHLPHTQPRPECHTHTSHTRHGSMLRGAESTR